MIKSNYFDEFHKFVPFLLMLFDTPPYSLELRKLIENILDIFDILLTENHKDAIVKLVNCLLIEYS